MKRILAVFTLLAPIVVYGQPSIPMPRTPNATSGSMPTSDNPALRGTVKPMSTAPAQTTGSMPTMSTPPRATMPTTDIRPTRPQPTNITGRWTDGTVPPPVAPAPGRRSEAMPTVTAALEDEEEPVPDMWTAEVCRLGLRDRVSCALSGF
jgi:hypothetical protein